MARLPSAFLLGVFPSLSQIRISQIKQIPLLSAVHRVGMYANWGLTET